MSRWLLLVASLAMAACGFSVGASGAIAGDDIDSGPTTCTRANWRDPAWASRYPLAVQRTRVTGTPGSFSVLVALTSGELIRARSDGEDLVFTAADGTSALPYEIEQFDRTTGKLLAWVTLSTVSSAADTELYLYFENPDAPSPTLMDAWPDHLAVWHLREDPGDALGQARDSTTRANHLTVQNMTSTDRVQGKIGFGYRFDAIDNGLTKTSFTLPSMFTYEAWIRPTQLSGYRTVIDFMSNNRWLGLNNDSVEFYTGTERIYPAAVTANAWHHVAATYNGSQLRIYYDGALLGVPASVTLGAVTSTLLVGYSNLGERFPGSIDELRIQPMARSADAIATDFSNQSAPELFVVPGSLEHCR
jgi:biopolymer transport protein ExbB